MTDDTGMLQHAIFSVPNTREGYTTDDNARALIVSTLFDENGEPRGSMSIIKTLSSVSGLSLARISFRYAGGSGIFSVRSEVVWKSGSEDSHGRALWALGPCWDIRRMKDCVEPREGF